MGLAVLPWDAPIAQGSSTGSERRLLRSSCRDCCPSTPWVASIQPEALIIEAVMFGNLWHKVGRWCDFNAWALWMLVHLLLHCAF